MNTAGNENVLHAFTGPPDGALPVCRLLRDAAGDLYGTTYGGGDPNTFSGTVFKVDPAGKETILYTFTGSQDGAYPEGALIRACDGHLYGTAWRGGSYDYGVVYKLDNEGNETVLYSFTGGADGAFLQAEVIRDGDGNLYGTTYYGGDLGSPDFGSGCGVVYKLTAAGKQTVLHTFTCGTDGALPYARLVQDIDGDLYGTTEYGGDLSSSACGVLGCGVVFKVRPPEETPGP